jgi:flagellar motor component MotA
MLVLIGYFVVLGATLGGFMIAGGYPAVLMHVSEFVVIGGIGMGVLVVASPQKKLKHTFHACIVALKGKLPARSDYLDMFKVLYELFTTGKKAASLHLMSMSPHPRTVTFSRSIRRSLEARSASAFCATGSSRSLTAR